MEALGRQPDTAQPELANNQVPAVGFPDLLCGDANGVVWSSCGLSAEFLTPSCQGVGGFQKLQTPSRHSGHVLGASRGPLVCCSTLLGALCFEQGDASAEAKTGTAPIPDMCLFH